MANRLIPGGIGNLPADTTDPYYLPSNESHLRGHFYNNINVDWGSREVAPFIAFMVVTTPIGNYIALRNRNMPIWDMRRPIAEFKIEDDTGSVNFYHQFVNGIPNQSFMKRDVNNNFITNVETVPTIDRMYNASDANNATVRTSMALVLFDFVDNRFAWKVWRAGEVMRIDRNNAGIWIYSYNANNLIYNFDTLRIVDYGTISGNLFNTTQSVHAHRRPTEAELINNPPPLYVRQAIERGICINLN